ncbi:MAG: type II toxin-antitoxin system RatA family toxin [Mycobacteriales bacterium]
MPTVTITSRVPDADAGRVFARIADFPAYARYTEAVRDVRVDRTDGDTVSSTWSVNFRNGVLRWSEVDRIDPGRRTIDFVQTAGDFTHFAGSWRVTGDGSRVEVVFRADFDLGMPSLAAMIDPIAEEALTDNMRLILRGLLGADVQITDGGALVAGGPA